jgi:hypothetical protein
MKQQPAHLPSLQHLAFLQQSRHRSEHNQWAAEIALEAYLNPKLSQALEANQLQHQPLNQNYK